MRTTPKDVSNAQQDYRDAVAYHWTLPESERWTHGATLKTLKARCYVLMEALRLGQ